MRKRRIMHVIWNINGVLILILLFFLGAAALIGLLGSWMFRPVQSVKVVDSQANKPKVTSYQLADEPTLLKDYYVFELQSDVIYRSKMGSGLTSGKRFGDSNDRCPVNLIFIALKDMKKYPLFASNVLILEKEYASCEVNLERYRNIILGRNLYSVVSKDTNDNAQLDENDRRDFYVSDYNGRNLHCVLKNINSYSIVDDNQIVLRSINNGKKSFILYDVVDDRIKSLLTENEVNHLGL